MIKKTATTLKPFTNTLNFFQEVRVELAKVIWPSRQQVIKLTSIVVGVSVFIALYIGLLDVTFTKLVDLLIIR